MDIEKMSLQELKSLAYDQIRLLEQTQNNLRLLSEKIKTLESKEDNKQ